MAKFNIKNVLQYFNSWDDTLKRFPVFIATVVSICIIISLGVADVMEEDTLIRLLLIGVSFALGVLNIHIYKESVKWSIKMEYLAIIALAILAFVGYKVLPETIQDNSNEYLAFVFGGIILALHFLVILVAFPKKRP